MSSIVQCFMAPDDASAALVLPTGPRTAFESLSYGNFDAEDAVLEWEGVLTGKGPDTLLASGEPRTVAGGANNGCTVFAVSSRLLTALADSEPTALDDLAEAWVRLRAEDQEIFDIEIVREIVSELAGLARRASVQGQGIYCWVA